MITDEEKRINFDYNKKMTKEDASTNISLNISEGVTKKLDLHVTSEETLKKNADINIETNDSILKSTLTEEELTKIANVKLDFMTKMKS